MILLASRRLRERSRLHERPVVRNRVGIDQRQFDRLAGLGLERSHLVAQVLVHLDRDGASTPDLARHGFGTGGCASATMSARIGWAAMVLETGLISGKAGERRRQVVDGREDVDRGIVPGRK